MAIQIVADISAGIGADFGAAANLISMSKECGADAVKFHSINPETVCHPVFAADQLDGLQRSVLTREQHFELVAACLSAGVDFVATPFDFASVDLIVELGASAICIDSGDATDLPLIAYAAQQGKPVFIGTAMCTLAEAADAYYCAVEEGAPRVVVMHGVGSSPAPLEELNLKAIATLAGELFCDVGYTDHSENNDACLAAAALGATVIEKELGADGPTFRDLSSRLRSLESALGSGDKRRMPSEAQLAERLRRTVFYKCDLPAGHVVTWDDLAFLRPVIGLSPAEAYRFVGRTLGVDMQAGELASEQDIAIVEIKQQPDQAR